MNDPALTIKNQTQINAKSVTARSSVETKITTHAKHSDRLEAVIAAEIMLSCKSIIRNCQADVNPFFIDRGACALSFDKKVSRARQSGLSLL